jgi:hypothetical protein
VAYWHHNYACTPAIRQEFRTDARACLHELARRLGFAGKTYELKYRSAAACARACGSVTLHHRDVRVQIGHTMMGGWEIRVRPAVVADDPQALDHFPPIYLLNDIEALALRVRNLMAGDAPDP